MQTTHDTPRRSDTADLCKAFGIVLVVWGHTPGVPPWATALIYSFHMPLFFFLSGYLLKTEQLGRALPAQVSGLARALLVPYVFFFLLSLGYWLATRHIGAKAAKFADVTAQDALLGFFTGLSAELFVNPTLWFFPCMFLTQVVYRAAWKLLPSAPWLALGSAVVACGVLALTLPWRSRLPWGLDIVWVALVFFAFGQWLRVFTADTPWSEGLMPSAGALLAVLAALWLGCSLWQGRVDLAVGNFGPSFMVYFVTAFCGIGLAFIACSRLQPHAVLRWLAQNTLLIFPLHPLFINFGSGVAKMLGLGHYGLPASVAFTVWGIVCTVPAAMFIKRYCAFVLGAPRVQMQGVA